MLLNAWVIDIFGTVHMAFISIVVCRFKSTKPKNHTSTLSIIYVGTTE